MAATIHREHKHAGESAGRLPAAAVAWYTIVALAATYTISFLDRQALVLLIDPIRHDLGISDTEISLLTGFAFAICYALMGIPMGRAADVWSRKKVIMLGVSLWGVMTMVCGFAGTFIQLFIGRMGVGVGEAALTPTAYSMVPDLVPPDRQARAMSVFVLGSFVGSGLSLIFGGWIIAMFSRINHVSLPFIGNFRTWQLVISGVGGLTLLALVPLSYIADPMRAKTAGGRDSRRDRRLADVLAYLWRARGCYVSIVLGTPLVNAFMYGSAAWLPTYFIRVHGWTPSTTGAVLGVVGIVSGIAGALAGGGIADRMRARGVIDANMRTSLIAVILSIPLPAVVVFSHPVYVQVAALGVMNFTLSMIIPLLPTALQQVTPRWMRAQISAIFLLIANLVGIGLGPTIIAATTQYLFHSDLAIGRSIAYFGAIGNAASALLMLVGLAAFRRGVAAFSTDDATASG